MIQFLLSDAASPQANVPAADPNVGVLADDVSFHAAYAGLPDIAKISADLVTSVEELIVADAADPLPEDASQQSSDVVDQDADDEMRGLLADVPAIMTHVPELPTPQSMVPTSPVLMSDEVVTGAMGPAKSDRPTEPGPLATTATLQIRGGDADGLQHRAAENTTVNRVAISAIQAQFGQPLGPDVTGPIRLPLPAVLLKEGGGAPAIIPIVSDTAPVIGRGSNVVPAAVGPMQAMLGEVDKPEAALMDGVPVFSRPAKQPPAVVAPSPAAPSAVLQDIASRPTPDRIVDFDPRVQDQSVDRPNAPDRLPDAARTPQGPPPWANPAVPSMMALENSRHAADLPMPDASIGSLQSAVGGERVLQSTPHQPSFHADTPRHVANQIAVVVSSQPGGTTEIALNPEELGRVRMSMTVLDASITVTVSAERPETGDLLRRHIDALAEEFRALGYDNIAFSFGTGEEQNAEQSPSQMSGDTFVDVDETGTASPTPESNPTGLDLRL